MSEKKTILLSGNPNVGKSSIFNILTGMNQHTGNWTGKTVACGIGKIKGKKDYEIIDLPGTYSLSSMSEEEIVARDAILFSNAYKNIIVVDSCLLERNLNLVLQILEINKNVLLCLNLCDEAQNKRICIDDSKLSMMLDVPIVMCSARNKEGISELIDKIEANHLSTYELKYGAYVEEKINEIMPLIDERFRNRFVAIKLLEGDKTILESIEERYDINLLTEELNDYIRSIKHEDIRNKISIMINKESELIACECTKYCEEINTKTKKIDKIITSKLFGIPISLCILFCLFYITIVLSNYPSVFLSKLFNNIEGVLFNLVVGNIPKFIYEALLFGVFRTVSWVISVMMPPLIIFFSLFSLAEECGFLPRIAFNFDKLFKCCGVHGKEALTMCMGFGCNACAIVGARIIDSPRDKLISVLTNNFIPCNGRFPLILSLITMFFLRGSFNGFYVALILVFIIVFCVSISLMISYVLSRTILKGYSSNFTLELPLYRKPKVLSVIGRSIVFKSLSIIWKAVKVSIFAGLIIWILSNTFIGGISLVNHIASFLDPFGRMIGLDGVILLAFILALPANEIVMPIILMIYLGVSNMMDITDLNEIKSILVFNGWTFMSAINVILFSIMHFPCGTTLLTIKRELGFKWMIYAFLIPLFTGILFLFLLNVLI